MDGQTRTDSAWQTDSGSEVGQTRTVTVRLGQIRKFARTSWPAAVQSCGQGGQTCSGLAETDSPPPPWGGAPGGGAPMTRLGQTDSDRA